MTTHIETHHGVGVNGRLGREPMARTPLNAACTTHTHTKRWPGIESCHECQQNGGAHALSSHTASDDKNMLSEPARLTNKMGTRHVAPTHAYHKIEVVANTWNH